ncbi:MAG TPA: PQQ-dependent sugar dehydrogenase [Gaiellaceae bacterium]|jgi:glucose/arabinose dehydrogenase
MTFTHLIAAAALALAGQNASYTLKPYASGFDSPLYAAAPRSEPGKLYVVEQGGAIWRLVNGRRQRTPFLDLRGRISSGGEQGLLSVAFSPRYGSDHLFYVNYTDRNGDTRVVRYRSNGVRAIPSTAHLLLFVKQPYANHNGGQLQFGPDGLLYVGMGDGGSGGDPQNHAQTLADRLGKILRYRAGRWQVAAYGARNPWRFSFDRATGDLFVADVGQNAWEEVDILPRGFGLTNLGWRVYEGNERYQSDQTPTPGGTLAAPVVVYHHGDDGCSISGGYVYRGSAVPAAQGRYFYGDYCSGKIWSFKPVGEKASDVRLESLHVDSLSSFGEDARGELYATSLSNGVVYRLSR